MLIYLLKHYKLFKGSIPNYLTSKSLHILITCIYGLYCHLFTKLHYELHIELHNELYNELQNEQKAELKEIANSCRNVLHTLEQTLDKYNELKPGHRSVGKRVKRVRRGI